MFSHLAKVFLVFLWSSVKFAIGVPLGYTLGFHYWEVLLYSITGGITGVFVFAYFSELLIRIYYGIIRRLGFKKKERKKFTRTNKTIVRVRKRYGLAGVAILTPMILSIPVGTFIAVRFFRDKKKVIVYMVISVVGWGIIYASFVNTIQAWISKITL